MDTLRRTRPQVMLSWQLRRTLVALLSCASACATVHRPATTLTQLQSEMVAVAQSERATRDSVIARLVRRAATRGDKTIDVLMLSGGGSAGAFGAGFLRGWRARSDNAMPTFDLITGISTGVLQAPYALIGSAAALDTLGALYREAEARSAPSIDWLFWLRHSGGVLNTKRFDRSIANGLHDHVRDELKRAFEADRQIVVGTTDYDVASGRVWSLNDVYDTTTAGIARSTLLLKAATAIPGIFPPVMLEGHLHGDGGVFTNVLPLLSYADYQQLAHGLAQRGMTDVTVRVYVIMNLWTRQTPMIVSPSDRGQIGSRANLMLFYTHQPQTIELLDALSRAVGSTIPGLKMEFRVALLPGEAALKPGATKLFDREFMRYLDEVGFAKAQSRSSWDAVPSAYPFPSPPRR